MVTAGPEMEVRDWAVPKGEVIKVWPPMAGCPWPDSRSGSYSFQASWEKGQQGRFCLLVCGVEEQPQRVASWCAGHTWEAGVSRLGPGRELAWG